MNKSACAALATVLVVTACATPLPPPVVAIIKAQETFPPKPLTLLYTTFQDHAVLQRDKPIPVWGLTVPGAQVEVSLGGQSASATADTSGHWQAVLAPMKAGGPYTLSAKSSSGENQTLTDVMLGDAYLCSGQSNMELPLRLATNYDSELKSAYNPLLRLFHVHRFANATPQAVFGSDASWSVTTPETAKEFSATCYYFGRNVQPSAGVAVGLIEDTWGGATIQAWISNDKLTAIGGYADTLDIVKTYAKSPKDADLKYRALMHAWFDANDPAMKVKWYDAAFDDSAWNELVAIGGWRPWPKLAKFDGVVWLRKTVELSAAEAQGAATLTLGLISNYDLAFVNGTEVGAGEGYDVVRHYPVPAGTLHEGKNLIAVAIQMGGAFLDPAEKMSLKLASGAAKPIAGAWKWNTSVATSKTPALKHQPWLNQFGVSTLYNGMIVPLGPTPIRGIVWYQGESDAGQPKEYARLLPALIEDWRAKFGADTPFYIVQLPSFGPATSKPGPSDWASLREVQREVVNTTPNTGLAVTIDLGSPDNIHPQAKQEVGRRLALLAKRQIYGQDVVTSGPTPVSITRTGKKVTITFEHVSQGLVAREWDRAIGFSLCDAAGDCRFTDGYVQKDKVELNASHQPKAVSVRFCWADSPLCNLYNSEGLPAGPFEMAITGKKLNLTPRDRDFDSGYTAK
jgi:sialate O-acetylesterase